MKNLKRHLFVIAILLGSFGVSQAQSTKEMLAQKWVFSFDSMLEEMKKTMTESERQELAKMPAEQKEMMKSMIGDLRIQFNSDGTCVATTKGKSTPMNWTLSGDGKTLTTTEQGEDGKDGKVTVLEIIELTSKKLSLREPRGNQKMVMVFQSQSTGKD